MSDEFELSDEQRTKLLAFISRADAVIGDGGAHSQRLPAKAGSLQAILDQPMCADFKQILSVRRIDCRPTTNHGRRVRVCVVGVTTSHAFKFRLAFSVSLIDFPTLGAGARSIARIDQLNRNTGSLCLVEHKAFQLVKRPTVQTTALSLTSPYPDTNTAQVFQSDTAAGALCSTNYLLRNYVVRVSGEPLFFTMTTAH